MPQAHDGSGDPAIVALTQLLQSERESDGERSQVFRGVVCTIFGGGVHSDVDPVVADKCLIDRFESAGAEAIRACMRGDEGLGHYLAALRRSGGYHC